MMEVTIGKERLMNIIKCNTYEEISRQAADIICEQIKKKPESVLGLATGSTPLGLYKTLIERYKTHQIDFSRVSTVNLDEYYPMSPENPQSYRYYMNNNLFYYINIDMDNTHVPDGHSSTPEENAAEYDRIIERLGGIDIQVLGIGNNGHIGFNEPESDLYVGTHLTELSENTRKSNARFFEDEKDIPTHAVTMGIGSIFKAKKIILLANGSSKAQAISQILKGRITTACPASLLQLHSDVTLICDSQALSE